MLTRVDQSLVQMLSEQNRTEHHSSKGKVTSALPVSWCLLLGEAEGAWGGWGWERHYGMRIGLAFFFCFLSFIFPVIMSALQYLMTAHLFRQFQVALL